MEISARVTLHALIPDTHPFVVYGIEVFTPYSRGVLLKRYTDFYRFHKQLCYFSREKVLKGKYLIDYIPRLPLAICTCNSIDPTFIDVTYKQKRKRQLSEYTRKVVRLFNSLAFFYSDEPWIKIISSFFLIPAIQAREQIAAIFIQTQFRLYKKRLAKKAKLLRKYRSEGFITNIQYLPDFILVESFSYLDLHDICSVALVCRKWYNLSKQPILWKTLNLFP